MPNYVAGVELFNKFKNYSIITEDNHWLWRGHLDNGGHGKVKVNRREFSIHRLALCITNNLDYDDKSFQVNHKRECKFPNCWNPEHLYKGTHKQNQEDRVSSMTHCKRGLHIWKEPNIGVRKDGRRYCRPCANIQVKNSYKRRMKNA